MIQINKKMPRCCDECWALDEYGDYPVCRITREQRGYTFDIRSLRMDGCPLIDCDLETSEDQHAAETGTYLCRLLNTAPIVSVSEWISVQDRLPKKNGQYLVALATGGVTSAWYFISTHIFTINNTAITSNVTHWMPIPEPPKEHSI